MTRDLVSAAAQVIDPDFTTAYEARLAQLLTRESSESFALQVIASEPEGRAKADAERKALAIIDMVKNA